MSMDFGNFDFGLGLEGLDLRDPQGRYPMDPGYGTGEAAVAPSAPVAAPAKAAATPAAPTAPLTKAERKEVFVEQRATELQAAGKPVNTVALEKTFDNLGKTKEGVAQITAVVQRAEPEVLQAIVPNKVVDAPAPVAAPVAAPAATSTGTNVLVPDPNWTGPGPGPMISVPVSPGTGGTGGTGSTGGTDGTDGTDGTGGTNGTVVDSYFEGSGKNRMRVTVFSNGYVKRVSAPEGNDDAIALEFQQSVETATSILQATLKYYGMDKPGLLADVKKALAERRLTQTSTIDDIGIQLRESVDFQERFSANEIRRAAKKPVYSVSQYLQLESSYRNTLLAAGMPVDFYNSPEDFSNFIANDISPDEIKSRVDQGYASVKNADPAIVNELKSLYGLDDQTLAAFFIDPSRTKDAVVRAARAAEVASQARQQAGISLGASAAELLVQQGITQEEARVGFAQVSQLQELTRPLQGEKPLTQEELVSGTLGTNAAASQRVAMTQRRRKAGFEEGGKVGLTAVGE